MHKSKCWANIETPKTNSKYDHNHIDIAMTQHEYTVLLLHKHLNKIADYMKRQV